LIGVFPCSLQQDEVKCLDAFDAQTSPTNSRISAHPHLTIMSCEAVNEFMAKESGRLSGEIARRGRISSPWVAVLEKDFFPDEIGHSLTRVIYQRTVPNVGEYAGWTQIVGSGTGSPGTTDQSCRPIAAVLSSRQTTTTAYVSEYVVDSDEICITDARASYKFRDQIREIKRNFEKNVTDIWEDRHRDQYVAALPATNKLVFESQGLTPGNPLTGDFDATAPDSQIHQDALDYVRWKMVHDGAGEEGAYGKIDGQPIFTVFMSSEQQRALIKGNPDVRQDYRDAAPAELLKPFGVRRVYAGFYHIIDDKAPRWDLDNGGWVRRPFYAVDGDGVAHVNPAYEAAEYEDIIIYHPKVVKCLMQRPLSSLGSGANVKAWDFSGEISWINEYDRTCNKYRDNGYWSARLRAAYSALIPEYGYAIRVLRCPGNLGTTACPTS